MALNRLCSIPPADSRVNVEIKPATKDHYNNKETKIGRKITTVARRSLHWFCNRRWHDMCSCDPASIHCQDSLYLEDISGIAEGHSKNIASTTKPRMFSYADRYIGTNGFSDAEILGSGGFGRVYRAVLPSDGAVVAVKCVCQQLGPVREDVCGRAGCGCPAPPPNLVPLPGWCIYDNQLLLVYDYTLDRSLDRLLFALPYCQPHCSAGSGGGRLCPALQQHFSTSMSSLTRRSSTMTLRPATSCSIPDTMPGSVISTLPGGWSTTSFPMGASRGKVELLRIVVLEIAAGRRAVDLTYTDDRIIMLDWVRRVSNEGELLNAGDHRLPDGSYSLSGIFGYMSSEYMKSGESTTMADVYNFGVVVLKVPIGMMAVDFRWPEARLVRKSIKFWSKPETVRGACR